MGHWFKNFGHPISISFTICLTGAICRGHGAPLITLLIVGMHLSVRNVLRCLLGVPIIQTPSMVAVFCCFWYLFIRNIVTNCLSPAWPPDLLPCVRVHPLCNDFPSTSFGFSLSAMNCHYDDLTTSPVDTPLTYQKQSHHCHRLKFCPCYPLHQLPPPLLVRCH